MTEKAIRLGNERVSGAYTSGISKRELFACLIAAGASREHTAGHVAVYALARTDALLEALAAPVPVDETPK